MIYKYKLIPLDMQTDQPAFSFDSVEPQVTIKIEPLNIVLNPANSKSNAGALIDLTITDERETSAVWLIRLLAHHLRCSELIFIIVSKAKSTRTKYLDHRDRFNLATSKSYR